MKHVKLKFIIYIFREFFLVAFVEFGNVMNVVLYTANEWL